MTERAPGLVIAIDGPAGVGKSTVARAVAQRLGLPVLDSGALYRAVALLAEQRGVASEDAGALAELADELAETFELVARAEGRPAVRIAGVDVTAQVRSERMGQRASLISAHPALRERLLPALRALGQGGCVAEGRDIGTVVFPQAQVKIFLTASPVARAQRRLGELADGARAATNLEAVQADLRARDERDSRRSVAPLRPAADAHTLDTSDATIEQVVERVMEVVARVAGPRGQAALAPDDAARLDGVGRG